VWGAEKDLAATNTAEELWALEAYQIAMCACFAGDMTVEDGRNKVWEWSRLDPTPSAERENIQLFERK
jgi:hypothetical protein